MQHAIKLVEAVLQRGRNSGAQSHVPTDQLNDFLRWNVDSQRSLANVLSPRDLDTLLRTKGYWSLQTMDGGTANLPGMVALERDQRLAALEALKAQLIALRHQWADRRSALVVPDTNVFLHHVRKFHEIDWFDTANLGGDVCLVVPIEVVDELDRQKQSGRPRVRSRARQTIKDLFERLENSDAPVTLRADDVGSVSLEVFDEERVRSEQASSDAEIVESAAWLQQVAGSAVTIATFDLGMKLRADRAGVATLKLNDDDNE